MEPYYAVLFRSGFTCDFDKKGHFFSVYNSQPDLIYLKEGKIGPTIAVIPTDAIICLIESSYVDDVKKAFWPNFDIMKKEFGDNDQA